MGKTRGRSKWEGWYKEGKGWGKQREDKGERDGENEGEEQREEQVGGMAK